MDARIIHEHALLKNWCPSSPSSMTMRATSISDYRFGRTFQSALEQAAWWNNPIRPILRSSPTNCKHPWPRLRYRYRCNSRQLNEAFTATVGVNASMAAADAYESGGDVAAAAPLDLPSLMTPPAGHGSADHEGRTVVDSSNWNGSYERQQHNPFQVPRDVEQRNEGLGIVAIDFLKGKHTFITGATGFVAKVLVEKILREQPEVGQLYLLIQPRNNKSPHQRLQDEVLNCRLFEVLRKKHGDSYPEFVRTKVSAVLGNITSKGLGIDPKISEDVASKVDVIVHSAASTNFHEQ